MYPLIDLNAFTTGLSLVYLASTVLFSTSTSALFNSNSSEQHSNEQPSSEQPSTKQPSSEQPSSKQPFTEQPSSEQPSSEQREKSHTNGENDKPALISVFCTADQLLLVLFVFVYKIGEQGFVAMYPLYLVDIGLSISRIGVITGLCGQFLSMAGSTLGGLLISKFG